MDAFSSKSNFFGSKCIRAKVVEVGEGVGGLEGELIELSKVATRPLRAVRLGLEMQSG